METPKVVLLRCPDYDPQRVESVLRDAIARLGGMEAFVRPGWRVILKPNIVRASPPERAIVTHPAVVRAVAVLVREAGAHAVVAESPGGPSSQAWVRRAFKQSGIAQAAEEAGAEVSYDMTAVQVSHPNGSLIKRLDILQCVAQADAVINLPKLKTHNLTRITAATKNLFGVIPGLLKMGYHSKLRQASLFSEMLIDVLTYVRPVLNITDAIVAMDGNGPSGGDPFQAGLILVSADPFAIDTVSAELVGMAPLSVPPLAVAARRGLTSACLSDMEVIGEAIDSVRLKGFRPGVATRIDSGIVPRLLRRAMRRQIAARTVDGQECESPEAYGSLDVGSFPSAIRGWVTRQLVVSPKAGDRCIGCGICAKSCPVQAITVNNGRAEMDLDKCIRCYCCHELCPEEAIELKRSLLARILSMG